MYSMDTTERIDLYRALDEMKNITAEGGTFGLKFRKYNRDTQTGGELVYIPHARIRPKATDEAVANSSYKLFFTDTDTGRALNCWQILIVEFNGLLTILN